MLYTTLLVVALLASGDADISASTPRQLRTGKSSGKVCYGHLGCFSSHRSGSIFDWLFHDLPWTPETINTTFLLYTQQNPQTYQELVAVKPQTIKDSNFKTSQKTRFIIHGYLDSGTARWLKEMCQAMLRVEDVNCICVDWHGGSQTDYDKAVANIHVVGAEVAYFIQSLQDTFSYPPSKVHLIGHSLGAHTAGLAGRGRSEIGRITGLDPAEPLFQKAPLESRLDPSDALLVDVIHTDASSFTQNLGLGGYGMEQPAGHLDFYPNGGKIMAGCMTGGHRLNVVDLIVCNHRRAYEYYTASISEPDGFLAYPASSYDAFQKGAGFPCGVGGCPLMGHAAENFSQITSNSQIFFLNTQAVKSFSSWRYKITVNVGSRGRGCAILSVSLEGSKGTTKFLKIHTGRIKHGAQYTNFTDSDIDAGVIREVTFVWRSCDTSSRNHLGASTVIVQSGNGGSVFLFCDQAMVNKNVKQTLKPCKFVDVPDIDPLEDRNE